MKFTCISFQPINTIQIPKARVETKDAAKGTARRRSKILAITRDIISKGNTSDQFSDEVKALSQDDLNATLATLDKAKVMVPKGDFLGSKADMNSSWKRNRELRRYESKNQ